MTEKARVCIINIISIACAWRMQNSITTTSTVHGVRGSDQEPVRTGAIAKNSAARRGRYA